MFKHTRRQVQTTSRSDAAKLYVDNYCSCLWQYIVTIFLIICQSYENDKPLPFSYDL